MAHKMTSNDPGFTDIEALSYRELADLLGVDRDFVWSIHSMGTKALIAQG
jgi:hypothetical protein